jgi:trehalose-phosphatase
MSRRLFGSLPEIGERLSTVQHVLIIVDFQGTLVPIPDLPDEARAPIKVRDLLRSLVKTAGVTLAVISGRERDDLAGRVDVPGAIFIGNHGLEISGPGVFFVEPLTLQFADEVQRLATEFRERLQDIAGADVQSRGVTLSISSHGVEESRRDELRRTVHSALANASHPFLLRESRWGYEVRPRAYWNKGHAVCWLLERMADEKPLPIYVGDDNTDEDAFAAMPEGISVKVGEPSGTTAQYFVEGPREVQDFLTWILEQLRARDQGAVTS